MNLNDGSVMKHERKVWMSGLSSEMIWELRVEVAADASEAKWSSRVTMGDQVMSISKGVVRLTAE